MVKNSHFIDYLQYIQYIKIEVQQNFIIVLLKTHDLLSCMCIMVILQI